MMHTTKVYATQCLHSLRRCAIFGPFAALQHPRCKHSCSHEKFGQQERHVNLVLESSNRKFLANVVGVVVVFQSRLSRSHNVVGGLRTLLVRTVCFRRLVIRRIELMLLGLVPRILRLDGLQICLSLYLNPLLSFLLLVHELQPCLLRISLTWYLRFRASLAGGFRKVAFDTPPSTGMAGWKQSDKYLFQKREGCLPPDRLPLLPIVPSCPGYWPSPC